MTLPKVPQRTTPGFAFSMINRALLECLGMRRFGREEVRKAIEFFATKQPECAFCGSPEVKRWDHLIPISQGGETVLGNMVLSCANCDDSKRDLPYKEWMTSVIRNSTKSRGRIKRIQAYVKHFGYTPVSLEQRLTEEELKTLNTIRSRLGAVRRNTEMLIKGYQTRTSRRRDFREGGGSYSNTLQK